jgi:hypothetical protein
MLVTSPHDSVADDDSSMESVIKAHALDDSWRDGFGIEQSLKSRHVLGQVVFVVFMHTSELSLKGPQSGPKPHEPILP